MDNSDLQTLINAEIAIISKLFEINTAIESHHKRVNIAKTTCVSVSTLGVVSTISGVCLAPATGGLSLALTTGGIGAGIVGGASSIGTDIISHFKYKKYAKELEELLKTRLEAYLVIGNKIEGILKLVNENELINTNTELVAVNNNEEPKTTKTTPKKVNKKTGAIYSTSDCIISNPPIKCAAKPASTSLALTGLSAVSSGIDSVSKIYDTSKILQFLYLNREIYSISTYSASLLAQNQLSGLLIGTVRESLNKGLLKLGARVGLDGLKVGAKTMLIGLGVVGVAWDAYSLVKTWSNKPEMWKEVQGLIQGIQDKVDQLELFIKQC